jgi:uncharacterized repeat protein (TIGR01451 family)
MNALSQISSLWLRSTAALFSTNRLAGAHKFAAKLLTGCLGSVLCLVMGFVPQIVNAQSSACTANEDLVTFNFGTANTSNASGTTGTWTGGTFSNSYLVSTNIAAQHTISFAYTTSSLAVIDPGDPSLGTQGNNPNPVSANVDTSAPGTGITITFSFSRLVTKFRFNAYDLDRTNTWQDVLFISGFDNNTGIATPTLVPTTPGNYSVTSVGNASQITTIFDRNCAATDTLCNLQVNFASPLNQVVVAHVAGPDVAAPVKQRVAFNDFSYCVPRPAPDLKVDKTSGTATFVAGATTTYLLKVTNQGLASTTGQTSVTDVISTQGVSFVSPQAPPGWTCALSTTTFAADTASCFTATAIAAGGTTVLTLTIAISPAATATTSINKAKVYGGGDINKPLATTTGPLANCDAASENRPGAAAFAGCSFESTPLVRQALLTVTKTNGINTVIAGATTTYTITFANLGPSDAPGSLVLDPIAAGLNCNAPTFTSTPLTSVTVSPLSTTSFQVTGVTLTSFPANSTATFLMSCGVTATGLP